MNTQQFEVIRPKCAGLDVHKKSVVAAVCTSDPVTLTASYKTKVFNTTNSDIAALRDWLLAVMSAWNPRVNTGFPFLISLNRTCMSSSHTPSM
jgi:hypothetical protein